MNTQNISIAAKNLDFLMKKHNLNPTSLAAITNANQPTLFRIMSGESLDPRTSSLLPYARYFGIDVADLRTKDLTATLEPNTQAVLLHGKIPVIDWNDIKDWSFMEDKIQNISEWRSTTRPHSDKTFALRVMGVSMTYHGNRETFEDGDIILVDPKREPAHGSLVVVESAETNSFIFRKLYIEDGKYFLVALNPHWTSKIVELADLNLIKGVVFEKQVDF